MFYSKIDEFCEASKVVHPNDALYLYRAIAEGETMGRFKVSIKADDIEIKDHQGQSITLRKDITYITSAMQKGPNSLVIKTETQRKYGLDFICEKFFQGKDPLESLTKYHMREEIPGPEKESSKTVADIFKAEAEKDLRQSLDPGKIRAFELTIKQHGEEYHKKIHIGLAELDRLTPAEAHNKVKEAGIELFRNDPKFELAALSAGDLEISEINLKEKKQEPMQARSIIGIGLGR